MTVIYVLGVVIAIALLVCVQFPLARIRAARKDLEQVNILGGLAQFIRWELNEIVIFERDGRILIELLEKDIKENKGGARFIYALRGETVGGRVGLGLQSLTWKDEVNIQEIIPCSIEVVVWWAVSSSKVSEYFFGNDAEKHPRASKAAAARGAAAATLKKLTGARINKVASQAEFQISLIELLLLKQTEYRAVDRHNNITDNTPRSAANISANLESVLQAELNVEKLDHEAQNYGLRIDRIEVQSIKWATKVQNPVLEMLLDRLKVEHARSQAQANQIIADAQAESYAKELHLIAKELGIPVTQMRELLRHLPKGSDNTQDEMTKAIIFKFKNLNPKPEFQGQEIEPDAIESPKDESDSQETDEVEPSKDEPEK